LYLFDRHRSSFCWSGILQHQINPGTRLFRYFGKQRSTANKLFWYLKGENKNDLVTTWDYNTCSVNFNYYLHSRHSHAWQWKWIYGSLLELMKVELFPFMFVYYTNIIMVVIRKLLLSFSWASPSAYYLRCCSHILGKRHTWGNTQTCVWLTYLMFFSIQSQVRDTNSSLCY